MSRPSEFRQLIEALIMLFDESARFHRVEEIRSLLETARSSAVRLYRHLETARDRYVVGVVGLGNVGKSTLINAIFEEEISPKRNGPCTAFPIEFVGASEPAIRLKYGAALSTRDIRCRNTDELRRELSHFCDEGNQSSDDPIQKITVSIPHQLLSEGLILADTPGFGAAQRGEAAGSHEWTVKQYLAREVCQAVWVVLAEQAIGARELSFFNEHLADICDHVAVTGCEEWDETDCDRFRRRLSRPFGHRPPEFHFVSGITREGVADLADNIKRLALPEARYRRVTQGTFALCKAVNEWFRDYRNERGGPVRQRWRPDSWARISVAPPCDGIRERLLGELELQA
jgi:GTP-binding protein EngB required for normal cell division